MSDDSALAAYGRARDAFFAGLVERLRADDRVRAVWLTGAHGRAEADEWSDFDMHVAVRDGAFEAIQASPHSLFELGGEPLLVQAGFPSDSMPSGTFWLVMYRGPFCVDWNVGPARAAERPAASLVQFDDEAIPIAQDAEPLDRAAARARAQAQLEFFWAMAPIAAKYAGRGWTSRAVLQLDLLRRAYVGLARAASGTSMVDDLYHQNRRLEPDLDAQLPRLDTAIDPSAALAGVRLYCRLVVDLAPSLLELGASVNPAVIEEVERLCELAAVWAAEGGSSADRGSRR